MTDPKLLNDPKTRHNNTERWKLMGNGYMSLQDPDWVVNMHMQYEHNTIQYQTPPPDPSKLPKVVPNTHIPN